MIDGAQRSCRITAIQLQNVLVMETINTIA